MNKNYYPSGDPEQCQRIHREHENGRLMLNLECHKRALWRIGKLQMCSDCFEEYISTHDIEFDHVIRLSDNERDFERVDSMTRRSKGRRILHESTAASNSIQ
jgi:hypothetical protein